MSGTGYSDENCVKTSVCSKCEVLKTWNHWCHHDPSLCDDCYYVGGKYHKLTKEQAVAIESQKSIDI